MNTENIITMAQRHGATSYRNRADTQNPAYGFTEAGLVAFVQELLAGKRWQQIAEPSSGVRCHDAEACAMGQKPCPTPKACGCASAATGTQKQSRAEQQLVEMMRQRWANEPGADHGAVLHQIAVELLVQLEAIGAGGVESLRRSGECLYQIQEPATPSDAVRAFRDYLGVHDGIKLGGHAMDDMALDLARIALDFKHLIGMTASAHPDDAAVDALAALMKAKLAKQRAKGYGGWDTDCTRERLSELLRGHIDKGDPVDVANFCAFLAARGEGIATKAAAGAAT